MMVPALMKILTVLAVRVSHEKGHSTAGFNAVIPGLSSKLASGWLEGDSATRGLP